MGGLRLKRGERWTGGSRGKGGVAGLKRSTKDEWIAFEEGLEFCVDPALLKMNTRQ